MLPIGRAAARQSCELGKHGAIVWQPWGTDGCAEGLRYEQVRLLCVKLVQGCLQGAVETDLTELRHDCISSLLADLCVYAPWHICDCMIMQETRSIR